MEDRRAGGGGVMKEPNDVDVFNDLHFHVCPKCLHIWSHTTAQSVIMGSTKAHRCSECKRAQGGMGWLSMRAAVIEREELRKAREQA